MTETISESVQNKKRKLEVPGQTGLLDTNYRELLLRDYPLLDVRAPVEFAKGAFPNSLNLPLLNDEEREAVGIQYKQSGQESAIDLGAELITLEKQREKVAQWISYVQANPQCRLYCFRGGLRSRITQHWLAQAGVQVPLIEGGYKALRSYLIDTLDRLCRSLSLVLIGGRTGIGKTMLLKKLAVTLDLEHLANHRGSSFGTLPDSQPSNIDFENALTIELLRIEESSHSTVFVEDEARLIGRVCLPDTLREAMSRAPIYILECDMQTRVHNCMDDYVVDLLSRYKQASEPGCGFSNFAEHHRNSLARIKKRFGGNNYNQALHLLNRALKKHQEHNDINGYAEFIQLLLSQYYDPMYDYQLSKKQQRIQFSGSASQIIKKVSEA